MSSDTRLDYPRLGTHVGQQVGWRERVITFSHALILPDGPDYRYLWKTEIHAAVSRYFHAEALRPAQGLRSWGVSRGVGQLEQQRHGYAQAFSCGRRRVRVLGRGKLHAARCDLQLIRRSGKTDWEPWSALRARRHKTEAAGLRMSVCGNIHLDITVYDVDLEGL